MHAAITIPDLLLLVFQPDLISGKDLLQAALTCRTWSMCALDVLWGKYEVPFRSIMELLGPLVPTTRSGQTFYNWNNMINDFSAEGWTRFLRHTWRITRVKLRSFALDPLGIHLLERLTYTYGGPIFPALHSVNFETSLNMFPTASLLAVPTLKTIRQKAGEYKPGVDVVMREVMAMVETVLLESQPKKVAFKVDEMVEPPLSCFAKLKRLSLELSESLSPQELSPTLLQRISDLKDLTSLEIVYSGIFMRHDMIRKKAVMPTIHFPSLQRLLLRGCILVNSYNIQCISAPELEDLGLEKTTWMEEEIDAVVLHCRAEFPNLTRFSLETAFRIKTITMKSILSLPTLRHLTVTCPNFTFDNHSFSADLAPMTREIETLKFRASDSCHLRVPRTMALAGSSFLTVMEKAPRLTELAMGLGSLEMVVPEEVQVFPQLELLAITVPLELSGDVEGWDAFALKLAKLLPSLRVLELAFRSHTPFSDYSRAAQRSKQAVSVFWNHHYNLHRTRAPGWTMEPSPQWSFGKRPVCAPRRDISATGLWTRIERRVGYATDFIS